jgi:hypothetical protein
VVVQEETGPRERDGEPIPGDQLGMDRFVFLQADRERSMLIDHLGACERILKTSLPMAYAMQIRQFLILFLATLPFALLAKIGWLTPVVTMLAAYPIPVAGPDRDGAPEPLLRQEPESSPPGRTVPDHPRRPTRDVGRPALLA